MSARVERVSKAMDRILTPRDTARNNQNCLSAYLQRYIPGASVPNVALCHCLYSSSGQLAGDTHCLSTSSGTNRKEKLDHFGTRASPWRATWNSPQSPGKVSLVLRFTENG